MLNWYEDKSNHPMYGKTHTAEPRMLISKPGKFNPRFGKEDSLLTRQSISDKMSKHPDG